MSPGSDSDSCLLDSGPCGLGLTGLELGPAGTWTQPGRPELKMAAHDRPLYKVSFHWGLKGGWDSDSCPPGYTPEVLLIKQLFMKKMSSVKFNEKYRYMKFFVVAGCIFFFVFYCCLFSVTRMFLLFCPVTLSLTV